MFVTLIVLITDIVVIALCLRFIMRFAGTSRIQYLNPFSLMFYKEFVAYGIVGTSLFMVGFGRNYFLYNLAKETLRIQCWIVVLYCALIVFGMLFFLNSTFGNVITKYFSDFEDFDIDENVDNNTKIWVWLFLGIESIFFVFYCYKVGYFPISKMFSLSSYELAALRYQDKFEYSGNAIIRNVIFFILPYLTSYTSYILSKRDPISFSRKVQLYLCVFVSVLCLTARFEKSYFIYYFIGFLLLPKTTLNNDKLNNSLYNNDNNEGYTIRNKNKTNIVALSAIVLFGIIYVGYIQGSTQTISTIYRIFYSEIIGLYGHFIVFPSHHDFLNFQYYPNFVAYFFGHEKIRSSRITMLTLNNSAYAGHMNSFFAAEAYANGGWIAIIVSPFVVALSIYITYYLFSKLGKKNAFSVSAAVYFAINTPITGGFLDFLYNPTLIMVFIIAIVVKHCYFIK